MLLRAPRAVLVSEAHPLASRTAVTTEDLADFLLPSWDVETPAEETVRDVFVPRTTPTGRPLRAHPTTVRTVGEAVAQVTRGEIVFPTVEAVGRYGDRDGLRFVPLDDRPPVPLGLIWRRDHRHPGVDALCAAAESLAASR